MRGKNSSFLLRVRASGPAPLLWPVCLPSSRSPDGSRSGLEVLSCVNIRNPIHCQDSLPICDYEPFHGCNILYSVYKLCVALKYPKWTWLAKYSMEDDKKNLKKHKHTHRFVSWHYHHTPLSETFREMEGNVAANLCLDKLWARSAVYHLGWSVCARRGKTTLFCLGWEFTSPPEVPNTAALCIWGPLTQIETTAGIRSLKCLPRKCDYSKKVQASSMINGDTNIPGNKEICHFLRQSIKQHVQMFPKQHKDGLLWRSSGWTGLISQMRRSKTSGTELIRWSVKCWFTSLHSLPRVKPIICRTRRNAFGHAEPNCGH